MSATGGGPCRSLFGVHAKARTPDSACTRTGSHTLGKSYRDSKAVNTACSKTYHPHDTIDGRIPPTQGGAKDRSFSAVPRTTDPTKSHIPTPDEHAVGSRRLPDPSCQKEGPKQQNWSKQSRPSPAP
eukprot:2165807-Pyramimonas_sp.AAC.1